MFKWGKGWVSNFDYLLKINNLAGRSYNDLSQYYVFPWVVKCFKGAMDKDFLSNQNNFRDLKKPIGMINPEKEQDLLNRFSEASSFHNSAGGFYPHLFG